MVIGTSTQNLAISLPVVVDFQGTLSKGVTDTVGLDTLSFHNNSAPPVGATLSVLFHFGRNMAYMPLTARVESVSQASDTAGTDYRIDVALASLTETERRVLESAFTN
jgi:hypothetical protein